MVGRLKDKHVLLCGTLSEIGLSYARLLLAQGVKSLMIVNDSEGAAKTLEDSRVNHLLADVNKIADLEGVYAKTLEINKRIDVVVNSREVVADSSWEAAVTTHINSMICNTLLAMKHLGKMNGGRGGLVVNSLTILGAEDEDDSCRGILGLLNDLDRSFGNPYYYSSTGVQILTMCTNPEADGPEGNPDPSGATTAPGSRVGSTAADALLHVLEEKKSALDEPRGLVEEFEISVRN